LAISSNITSGIKWSLFGSGFLVSLTEEPLPPLPLEMLMHQDEKSLPFKMWRRY
jgi:hypothetical protein